jgi:hypothetical protein
MMDTVEGGFEQPLPLIEREPYPLSIKGVYCHFTTASLLSYACASGEAFFSHKMTSLLPDKIKLSFIRAIGDPRLRPQCIWVSENGQVCPNDVSMDSRNLASTELSALQGNISIPTRKNISRIASFLLCEDCKVHEILCPEIVRRLGEKYQQPRRSLFPCYSRLYHYSIKERQRLGFKQGISGKADNEIFESRTSRR